MNDEIDGMRILVTGGCGFIGSNYIRRLLGKEEDVSLVNLDKLTYAGNINNLKDVAENKNYNFIHGDICDEKVVERAMDGIDCVVHFAAESHVDRSIEDGSVFIRTNVLGTQTLLNAALKKGVEKFIQVSTDEVYGSTENGSFKEEDILNPSSPYSSSKSGADLLALSYHKTYDLPVMVTRCTNNYGPYQYPEKLIPRFVTNLIRGIKVPIYGTGKNVRDWIHVDDHCSGIDFVLRNGKPGEIYNIGGGNELSNLEITDAILECLGKDHSMVHHVEDRKGHDLRYSLSCEKMNKMGWAPEHEFKESLSETVRWYRDNRWWWEPLLN